MTFTQWQHEQAGSRVGLQLLWAPFLASPAMAQAEAAAWQQAGERAGTEWSWSSRDWSWELAHRPAGGEPLAGCTERGTQRCCHLRSRPEAGAEDTALSAVVSAGASWNLVLLGPLALSQNMGESCMWWGREVVQVSMPK